MVEAPLHSSVAEFQQLLQMRQGDDLSKRMTVVPEGTLEVPAMAFKGCTSIQGISIPDSVTRRLSL